jgi:hypothetical protein
MKEKTVKQKRNKTIEGRQSRKNYKNGKWDNTKIMYGCAKKRGGNKEEPKEAEAKEADPYYLHLLGDKFGSGIRYLSRLFGDN